MTTPNHLLFIHIPKTGGQSIVSTFGLYDQFTPRNHGKAYDFKNDKSVCFGHADIKTLLEKKVLSYEFYNESFKFCIVRNPYERIVSLFHYLASHQRFQVPYTFKNFIKYLYMNRNLIPKSSDTNVVNVGDINSQWNQMVSWIPDDIDKIFRFENFADISDEIKQLSQNNCNKKMIHKNLSSHRPYQEYYDGEVRKLIEDLYQDDFERFNYSF